MIFVTHTDLDGISSVVLNEFFGIHVNQYVFMDYERLYDKEENLLPWWEPYKLDFNDSIVIADLSVHPSFYNWISTSFKDFKIFDHHQKSLDVKGKPNCYVDEGRSGTKLYYDYLMENEAHKIRTRPIVESYSALVDVYDRWDKTSTLWPQAEELNRVFWQSLLYYKKDDSKYESYIRFQSRKFLSTLDNSSYYFTDYEHNLIQKDIEKEEKEYELALKNLVLRTDEKGIKYLMWHGATKISACCSRLLGAFPEVKYVINVNTYSGKNVRQVNGKLSVRSRTPEEFDVTTLNGINGHLSAGGGSFSISAIKNIWFSADKHLGYK